MKTNQMGGAFLVALVSKIKSLNLNNSAANKSTSGFLFRLKGKCFLFFFFLSQRASQVCLGMTSLPMKKGMNDFCGAVKHVGY